MHHPCVSVINEIKPKLSKRVMKIGGEIGIMPLLEKISIKRADHVVTVSEFSKKYITDYYHIPYNKVTCIYNGHKWVSHKRRKKKDIHKPG